MDHGTKYLKKAIERQVIFWENQNRGHMKEYLEMKEREYSEKTSVDHWKEGYYQGKEQGSEEIIRELKYLIKIVDIYFPDSDTKEEEEIN